MNGFFKRFLVCGSALLAGCAEAPARVPEVPTNASEAARRDFYEHYRFTTDRGFWSTSWKRSDGSYSWGELQNVAAQFPETEDLRRRAQTRSTVIGTIGAVGGAVEGFTFGYNLVRPSAERMSNGEQFALYGVGGGLVLVSLVMQLAWHDPADDFSDMYDTSLRRSLGLDLPAQSARRSNGFAWAPRPVRDGYEWRF